MVPFPGYGDKPGFMLGNNDRFVPSYAGAIAAKSGFTDAARHTLVATAQRGNRRLVVALMRGEQHPVSMVAQARRAAGHGLRDAAVGCGGGHAGRPPARDRLPDPVRGRRHGGPRLRRGPAGAWWVGGGALLVLVGATGLALAAAVARRGPSADCAHRPSSYAGSTRAKTRPLRGLRTVVRKVSERRATADPVAAGGPARQAGVSGGGGAGRRAARHRARTEEPGRGAAARARRRRRPPSGSPRARAPRPAPRSSFSFDVAAHAVTNSTNRDTKYTNTSRPRNEPNTAPLGDWRDRIEVERHDLLDHLEPDRAQQGRPDRAAQGHVLARQPGDHPEEDQPVGGDAEHARPAAASRTFAQRLLGQPEELQHRPRRSRSPGPSPRTRRPARPPARAATAGRPAAAGPSAAAPAPAPTAPRARRAGSSSTRCPEYSAASRPNAPTVPADCDGRVDDRRSASRPARRGRPW